MSTPTPKIDFEAARQLWAGRFQAVLSTQSQAERGYPFGSVVPYCLDHQGLPLLLLSHLAQHTKNLTEDPRCALTLYEATDDVQQSERLTCIAECSAVTPNDFAARQRFFRYYPNNRVYHEQLNFRLFRLTPRRFHYNGGFATARWLGPERILRISPFGEQEIKLADQITEHYAPELESLIDSPSTEGAPVRIAGIDSWGLDLGRGPLLRRRPFPQAFESIEAISDFLNLQRAVGN